MEVITVAENISNNMCSSSCCGCVGYAYVPVQEFINTNSPAKALANGTLFPELDLDINEYGKVCKQWGGDA